MTHLDRLTDLHCAVVAVGGPSDRKMNSFYRGAQRHIL